MFWKSGALFVAAAFLATAAIAKGLFQAEGMVSEVRIEGEEVVFRFVGAFSFNYAMTPPNNPKMQRDSITIDAADVIVHIGRWTERNNPSVTAQEPDTERVYQDLSMLAARSRKVRLSIDNPSLSFSNLGELNGLSGTYAYAVDAST